MGLSFTTIPGSGSNGAIIHYHPERATCAKVEKSKMFLCDSGGQYRYVS
jgi:Xaa-Pro aminopeptidase